MRAEVVLVGLLGGDEAGRRVLESLGSHGIGGEGLLVDPGRPTPAKTRVVAQGQRMVRIDQEESAGCSEHLEGQLRFVEEALSRIDPCIVSDDAKEVVSPGLARRVIRLTTDRGKPVVVDPKGPTSPSNAVRRS